MKDLTELTDEELKDYEQQAHQKNSQLFDALRSKTKKPFQIFKEYNSSLEEGRRILREWNRRDTGVKTRKIFHK